MEKKRNIIKRSIYLEALALDSIYHVLKYSDRIYLHRCLAEKATSEEQGSEALYLVNEIIKTHRWTSPEMKYPEFDKDFIYYKDEDGTLRKLEEYPERHKITLIINKIFNNEHRNVSADSCGIGGDDLRPH